MWLALAVSVWGCSGHRAERGELGQSRAAVTIGSELPGDTVVPTLAMHSDFASGSAFDGANHLVVWLERADTIAGARITSTGTVLDPLGFPIARRTSNFRARVAFGGGTFLVVWDDQSAVKAARVSSNATVVDTTPLDVGAGIETDVGFDGSNFIVTWIDDSTTPRRLLAARVSVAGVVLDQPATEVATGVVTPAGNQAAPRISGGSGQSLVCWEDERSSSNGDIFCSRISAAGAALDAGGFELTGGFPSDTDRGPSVAYDGAQWLVVWTRSPLLSASVVGARVDATGATVDASPLSIAAAAGSQVGPSVAFDGTNWVVAWTDTRGGDRDVMAARVQSDGTVLDGPATGIDVSTATDFQVGSTVSAGSGSTLVAWTDYRNDPEDPNEMSDVFAARLDGSGTLLDGPATSGGIPLSFTANTERRPAAAWSGSAWLVVWEDWRNGSLFQDLRAARYDASGTLLDTSAIAIALESTGRQRSPSVASDGSGWLVTYVHDVTGQLSQVHTTRVDASGAVLDGANGVPVSPAADAQDTPCVAWGGSSWLVTYQARDNMAGTTVRGVRLDGAGSSLGGLVVADAMSGIHFAPAVSFDGTRHLVTWVDALFGRVKGARVAPDGTVLDSMPFVIGSSWGVIEPMTPLGPRVASSGSGWMVAWEDTGDIVATLVDSAGTVGGAPFPIATGPSIERWPTVGHDGQQYLVVWEDDANAGTTGIDLRGTFVTDAGMLLNTTRLDVSSLGNDEATPWVAGASGGNSLVAYQRFDAIGAFRSDRMRARIVTSGAALGASCTNDDDCVSHHCASNLCALPLAVDGGADGGDGAAGAAGDSGAAGAGGATLDAGDGGVAGGGMGGVDGGAGSGGSSGAAGSAATGGSAGAGASASTGGSAGSGGAGGSSPTAGTGGTAGSGVDGGVDSSGDDSENEGGCSCRVPSGRSPGAGAWLIAALLVLRRRRAWPR